MSPNCVDDSTNIWLILAMMTWWFWVAVVGLGCIWFSWHWNLIPHYTPLGSDWDWGNIWSSCGLNALATCLMSTLTSKWQTARWSSSGLNLCIGAESCCQVLRWFLIHVFIQMWFLDIPQPSGSTCQVYTSITWSSAHTTFGGIQLVQR